MSPIATMAHLMSAGKTHAAHAAIEMPDQLVKGSVQNRGGAYEFKQAGEEDDLRGEQPPFGDRQRCLWREKVGNPSGNVEAARSHRVAA